MAHRSVGPNVVQRRVQWNHSPATIDGLDGYRYTVDSSERGGREAIRPHRRKVRASDGLPLPLWLTNTFFAISFILSSCYLLGRWRVKMETSEKLHHLTWAELLAVILDMSSFIYLISFSGIGFVQNSVAQLDSDDDEPVTEEVLMQAGPRMRIPPRRDILSLSSPLSSPFSSMESISNHPSPQASIYSDSSRETLGISRSKSNSSTGEGTPEARKNFSATRGMKLAKHCHSSLSTPPSTGKSQSSSHFAFHSPASVGSSASAEICVQESFASLPLEQVDVDLARAVAAGEVPSHSLENRLGDANKAAQVRRLAIELRTGKSLQGLPLDNYDYDAIRGACCEMVVGHVTIPMGVAGPLLLDGREFFVPMATTEGCLVASTNRGCKAIFEGGGASSVVYRDGMTRAPVVQLPSVVRAAEFRNYLEDPARFKEISETFNSTSRFGRLQGITCAIAGRNVFVRFRCSTGDAMGMNMVSKGVQSVFTSEKLLSSFPDMRVVSISGNFCADKKATAVNWIEGRGKSVVCEAVIPGEVVKRVLKTSVEAMVELNISKNLIGSAMAGAVGGFNAHASNIVTAVFLATGQDPAQNVESSQCITVFEAVRAGSGDSEWDLHASVSMPSVEVGTVGGGTFLAPQAAALNLLGVKGAHPETPGENARQLARIVAGAVLAGELSLMSALATGHLVSSHLKYNRSSTNLSTSAAAAVAAVASEQPGSCAL